jgi:hypothetical protein
MSHTEATTCVESCHSPASSSPSSPCFPGNIYTLVSIEGPLGAFLFLYHPLSP